ncbi:hypothetical protein NQD34_011049 [Periophthalmus magnuspinnatus]|nr:hypothetical protein NQD34_011049 [Periophthalmus magnuspinnatus]
MEKDPRSFLNRMLFETVLEEVNGFGPFQILILVLLCSPRIVLPCHFLLNNFIAAIPPHHCDFKAADHDGLLSNLSEQQRLVVSLPLTEDGLPKACEMFPEAQFDLLSNGSSGSDLPTVHCSRWVYDNSTFTSTLATEFDLVCDRKSLARTASTIFFMGVMLGGIAFGFLCDKYGRKNMLLLSYALPVVFGLSSAFVTSYEMFAVLRFFTGFGLTGISIISLVLSLEWSDTTHRSFIGVMGSTAWSVGNMILAGLAFSIRDWRHLMLAVTAPLGLALLSWWWLPESARWLLANGKVEKARFYLNRCSKFNKGQTLSPQIQLESFIDIKDTKKAEKTYNFLDLVRTPRIRSYTIITGIVWYGVAQTYYGISLNISGFGLSIYLTHFIYSAIEVPAKWTIFVLLNIIGRKWCQAGTQLLTGICIFINIFIPDSLWYVRAAIAILGKGASEAAFTTVFLYTTEIFPTVIRQNAMGYTAFMSRLGVCISPLILLLEDVWVTLPQIILCTGAILSGLVVLLLPETLNIHLPETIEDVENPRRKGTSDGVESTEARLDSKLSPGLT